LGREVRNRYLSNWKKIPGCRYASTAVMQGAAEVMVYGTAVKFK